LDIATFPPVRIGVNKSIRFHCNAANDGSVPRELGDAVSSGRHVVDNFLGFKKKANSEYRIQSFLSSNEIIYRWETLFVLKFHREQLVVHPRTVNGLFDRFAEPKISDNCL
jgi:hypothetical protein